MQVPITTLSWNIERLTRVLGDLAKAGEAAKLFRRIRDAHGRLVTLVEDMLSLAKLQEGAFVVARRPTQLSEVVRKALRSIEGEALRRNVHLQRSADPRKIPLTLGDPERLTQVVGNLLSNAVKYTPRGGTVRVSLRQTQEIAPPTVVTRRRQEATASRYVLCSVEDTGIGIPKDEQQNVFQQFFRGRKAVATNEGGTGLGLFLVRTIIEQHEGAIWFTSREGYGTTFFFTVPIVNPYAGEASTNPRR
jgi:signal transduction histidine kinase